MDISKPPGLGILKSVRARHAEEAIGQSEGLVTVLRLTQADLKAAEEALRTAKELYQANEFSKALHEARKAEAIAITLDERHNGYQKAARALRTVVEEMRRLGLHTEALEAVLGRSEEKVLAGIWENGAFVPNYLEARMLVERAERDGRELLEKATAASNAIFLSELALEALTEMPGLADPKAFAEGAARDLEAGLHDATRELALGNVDAAIRIAKGIEERAVRLRADYAEAHRTLGALETQLAELRGEGIATHRIEDQIAQTRKLLERGHVERGIETARRLSEASKGLGETYRAAVTGLVDAEILYVQLTREGFHSYDADAALRDARKAIREGYYARALDHLKKAHAAFVRRRNVREALARALEETRARVIQLKDTGLPFIPDIQELLQRAEREFKAGNYSGSSEDLRIATLLLGQPGRSDAAQRRS